MDIANLTSDTTLAADGSSQSSNHYSDVIMSAMASQITGITIVYSTVYSGADQRKHQSSASQAFVGGGEFTGDRWIPHTKGQFDDVIMMMHFWGKNVANVLLPVSGSGYSRVNHNSEFCISGLNQKIHLCHHTWALYTSRANVPTLCPKHKIFLAHGQQQCVSLTYCCNISKELLAGIRWIYTQDKVNTQTCCFVFHVCLR